MRRTAHDDVEACRHASSADRAGIAITLQSIRMIAMKGVAYLRADSESDLWRPFSRTADGNMTPMCPHCSYRNCTKRVVVQEKGVTTRRRNPYPCMVPKRGLEPPRAWLAH